MVPVCRWPSCRAHHSSPCQGKTRSARPSRSGGSPVNNTTCITDSRLYCTGNMFSTAFTIWWITFTSTTQHVSQTHGYIVQGTCSARPSRSGGSPVNNTCITDSRLYCTGNMFSTAFMIWWITCQQHNMYHRLTVILYREHAQHGLHDLVDHLSTTHISQTHSYIVQGTCSAQPSRSHGSPVNNTTFITDSRLYCTGNMLSTAFTIWWITCQQHNMYHRLTVILYREHAQHGLHDLVDHLSTTQHVSQTHGYIVQRTCSAQPSQSGGSPVNNTTCITDSVILYREHAQHSLHNLVDHLSTTHHVLQTHGYIVQGTCSAWPSRFGGSPVNKTTCITDSQLYCTGNMLSTAFMIWWITCQQHNMYHRLSYTVQRTCSAQPSQSGGSPVNNTTCITDSRLSCTENMLSVAFMIWWITCQQHMYHRLTVILYREHAQHGLHDLVDHLSKTLHVSQTHSYIVQRTCSAWPS